MVHTNVRSEKLGHDICSNEYLTHFDSWINLKGIGLMKIKGIQIQDLKIENDLT